MRRTLNNGICAKEKQKNKLRKYYKNKKTSMFDKKYKGVLIFQTWTFFEKSGKGGNRPIF